MELDFSLYVLLAVGALPVGMAASRAQGDAVQLRRVSRGHRSHAIPEDVRAQLLQLIGSFVYEFKTVHSNEHCPEIKTPPGVAAATQSSHGLG